jgi:amino acid transporter
MIKRICWRDNEFHADPARSLMQASDLSTSIREMPQGRKLTLLPLIALTYMLVSGGPYGLEDVVQKAGYSGAVLVLLLTPFLWCLPTALLVGELAAAIPEEGGYYIWVTRAMGRFWGFQQAWLSLAHSVFDMAIYPTLFVVYLSRLWPNLKDPQAAWIVGAAVIACCATLNIFGARTVGGFSLAQTLILVGLFAVVSVLAIFAEPVSITKPPPPAEFTLLGGIMVTMWNYMGWDYSSTIAGEVQRPQRTYPLATLGAVILVTLTYVLPVLAVTRMGIPAQTWETGSWVEVAQAAGGDVLGVAVVIGGMVSGFGMCAALVLAYSRVPVALAEDGYLPAILERRRPKNGVPWVAILVCACAWCLALPLGFQQLVALNVTIYGLCLLLDFGALVLLRLREPELPRPFRVPGGALGLALVGIGPIVFLGAALYHESGESVGPINSLLLSAIIVGVGPALYLVSWGVRLGLALIYRFAKR